MKEVDKIHRVALEMTLEAKERGAFKKAEWNAERDLQLKDIEDIIQYSKGRIEEADMDWILGDCRYIADQCIIGSLKDKYE